MAILVYILLSVLIVSLVSLIGILTVTLHKKHLHRALSLFVGFAAGALLSATFFDLLPESIEIAGIEKTSMYALLGIVVFFALEKFFFWYHCHGGRCAHHGISVKKSVKPYAYLNLIGDGIHNFIDGMVIAGAYVASVPLGVITSLAVVFHEIPQETGDFAILVNAGLSTTKALLLNFLTAVSAIIGALVAYFFLQTVDNFTAFLLPFAAGNFVYIATADLIPELHKESSMRRNLEQMIMFLLGIVVIILLEKLIASGALNRLFL
ncbi:ZIP family metal transporter [Candidatus Woesearchaeota archaeon]|nr:ZIP family metal transporter [Candidatus Woesearchaeota archaeon]